MSGETSITVTGNLTNDPELRRTPGGSAVANFTIASTPRTFDRQKNEWVDGETLFMPASVWRDAAEHVAESLTKGMRVIASGLLKSRTYETKAGEKRTVVELEVEEIGLSMRFQNVAVSHSPASARRTARTTAGTAWMTLTGPLVNRPRSSPMMTRGSGKRPTRRGGSTTPGPTASRRTGELSDHPMR